MTEEEQWASKRVEEVGYGAVPPDERKRIVLAILGAFKREPTIAHLYPTLAVMEGYLADKEIRRKLLQRLSIFLFHRLLHRKSKLLGDRPGVNDWLMIRWFWSHDPSCLEQLIVRGHRKDMVGETCRWMLGSVRARHPLVDVRLIQEERENPYEA